MNDVITKLHMERQDLLEILDSYRNHIASPKEDIEVLYVNFVSHLMRLQLLDEELLARMSAEREPEEAARVTVG